MAGTLLFVSLCLPYLAQCVTHNMYSENEDLRNVWAGGGEAREGVVILIPS